MDSTNFDPNFNAQRPTGPNIKKALTKLITSARPGDILVFHFRCVSLIVAMAQVVQQVVQYPH